MNKYFERTKLLWIWRTRARIIAKRFAGALQLVKGKIKSERVKTWFVILCREGCWSILKFHGGIIFLKPAFELFVWGQWENDAYLEYANFFEFLTKFEIQTRVQTKLNDENNCEHSYEICNRNEWWKSYVQATFGAFHSKILSNFAF